MKNNYWFQQLSACVDHHYGFPPSPCQFTNKTSQNVPKKFIFLAVKKEMVYWQKQNVRKCIRNSEKSMFPFHIYILLHCLQVLTETDTSVHLNEGASNVQVFDPDPQNKCCIVHFCKLQNVFKPCQRRAAEEKEKVTFCFIIRVIVTQRLLGNVPMLLSHLRRFHLVLTCNVMVIWLAVWKSWTNTTSLVCRTDATMPSFYFGGALEKHIHNNFVFADFLEIL